jgi:DNA-binding NarL/FixJ family response regulator
VKVIRVSIIAPAMAVRIGLRAILGEDPQVQVVAEAGRPGELDDILPECEVLVWAPGTQADLAEGFLALKRLFKAPTALLLLTNEADEIRSIIDRMVTAWGVLDPEATQAELLASLQALNEGLVVASPAWIKRIYDQDKSQNGQSAEGTEALTNRELEILQLLALGLTNKQIAARLKISAHTVKFHLSVIFGKLGTTNRLETVKLGLKNGLIAL